MYDTLYAILIKSENATLQYFILSEKVLDEKYLLKLYNVFQAIRQNSTNLFELHVCSILRLKLYSLNFAIALAQKRLLCLSEFVILVVH